MKNTQKQTNKKPNTKRRTYRNRIIMITSLVLAVLVTTWFLQEFILCNPNHNTERIRGFYLEDENSLDVVFVGSSEVYCAYAAGLAYKECGFTSYPYATEGNTVRNFKTIFDEIRRTQNPKLIIFEINGAIYGDKNIDKEVNLRRVTDNMPLNDDKVDLVERGATSDQVEYYLPFLKYHGAWDNMGSTWMWSISLIQDKLRGYNLLKGIKNRTLSYHPTSKVYATEELKYRRPLFRKSDEELRDFLQYLIDENVDTSRILFVRVPHITTDENITRYQRGNSIADTVRSYGFRFESFEADDPVIGMDVDKDFYNIEHMNVYGQQKFTKFFAHYLQDNYDITPSELTEKQKEEWDKTIPYYDAYVKYNEQVFSEGGNVEAAENYLCMRQINKLVEK